jgi:hypothetical protein
MSKDNNIKEIKENLNENNKIEAKKTNDKSLTTSISIKSNTENEKIIENKKKNKKTVKFSKSLVTVIDVESYKKFNEDISETRYYYNYQEKKNSKKNNSQIKCICILF